MLSMKARGQATGASSTMQMRMIHTVFAPNLCMQLQGFRFLWLVHFTKVVKQHSHGKFSFSNDVAEVTQLRILTTGHFDCRMLEV